MSERPEGFPKTARLTKRTDYLRIQRGGKKVNAATRRLTCVFAWRAAGTGAARMGLTVSTKVGNSAVRSRIKRLVREAYRRLRATEARLRVAPLDLVFIARPDQSVSARLCDIEPEVRLLVAKVLETQR